MIKTFDVVMCHLKLRPSRKKRIPVDTFFQTRLLKNHRWLGQAAGGGLAGPENPKDFWAFYGAGFIPA